MKTAMIPLAVVAACLLAACSEVQSDDRSAAGGDETPASATSTGVTVQVDSTAYAPGDTANVTVTNGTSAEILFAFICDGLVEGRVDGEWQPAYEPDCSRIRVRPTRLAPGASAAVNFRLALVDSDSRARCDAFRLRLRFQFGDSGGNGLAYSTAFNIGSK